MKGIEKDYWIYDHNHESIDSILAHISNIINFRKVNFALIFSKSEILETLTHYPEDFHVETKFSESLFTVKVIRSVGKNNYDHAQAVFVRLSVPQLYLLISDYKPALFKSLILKLINFNYPLLSRIFLRNVEIHQIFSSMKRQENIETRILRALFYSRLQNDKQDKDLKWTNRQFQEVFDSINEQNGWIRKIGFRSYTIKKKDISYLTKIFEGSISSDCHFIVRGNFEIYKKYFLFPMIGIIENRFNYLQVRSKRATDRLSEPLVIRFDEAIFGDKEWNGKFIEIMSEMKNVSITEYHTNPYIHISLLDYQDGSSYGIWIVSDDEINIIPQVRASVASMNRLLSYIYERIKEGDSIEYKPIELGVSG